jgi:small-conductance mechanosensitive channel
MNDPRHVDSPTTRAHSRQFAWQILVPILAVTALLLAVAVLVASGTGSGARTWADVSMIWLIAPMLIFALVAIIILGFLIYGISKLHQITPNYTSKIQGFFGLLSGKTRSIADGTTSPFIWFQQAGAIIKSIFGR